METSELTFPFSDDVSGTIRGYRVFTACRTIRGEIFRLEDHLDRLYYSCTGIYMKPPLPRGDLRELLQRIVARNIEAGFTEPLLIDVIFSGGLAGDTMKQSGEGAHLYVAVREMVPPPEESYQSGVALATFPHQRMCPDVKLLNYIGAVLGHQTVVPQYNAWDVLFLDPADKQTILEGSTFTVFFVDQKRDIQTPPLDGKILDSITRRVVLEIFRPRFDIKIREMPVRFNRLSSFSEAFLASTTRNILPVTRIDDVVLGNGLPGPVTRKVMGIFQEYLDSY